MSTILVDHFRMMFKSAHSWFEGTVDGVDSDLAHWAPPGILTPIASFYAHAVLAEDFMVDGYALGKQPTMMQGGSGISEPPPGDNKWRDWGLRVKVDLPVTRAFAQRVYSATDSYLAALTDADLQKPLDLAVVGGGMGTVAIMLNVVGTHFYSHSGEISAIKGLKSMKGYPM